MNARCELPVGFDIFEADLALMREQIRDRWRNFMCGIGAT
jgi:hypothetical protein